MDLGALSHGMGGRPSLGASDEGSPNTNEQVMVADMFTQTCISRRVSVGNLPNPIGVEVSKDTHVSAFRAFLKISQSLTFQN